MIGIAKTGSGKTLAFLLPMYRQILDQPPLQPADGPIALIMAPTRELAAQIHAECKKYKKATGIRVCTHYLFIETDTDNLFRASVYTVELE